VGSKNEKKRDLTDFLREESSMGPYCRGKTSKAIFKARGQPDFHPQGRLNSLNGEKRNHIKNSG
jgi:hypothetical protein